MVNHDFKPNSHKYKVEQQEAAKEEKRVEKVVKGKVTTKKKSEIRKFTDGLIKEDLGNVGSFALKEVLIPAAKKAISDIVTNGIDMILYGESGKTKKRSSGNYVSYNGYSDRDRRDRRDSARTKSRFDFDDIIFETRAEAMMVVNQMEEVIERYGFVTVGDFYDMADLTAPYTAEKYGWTSIRTADVVRIRDGYIIKLPRAMAID